MQHQAILHAVRPPSAIIGVLLVDAWLHREPGAFDLLARVKYAHNFLPVLVRHESADMLSAVNHQLALERDHHAVIALTADTIAVYG